MNQKHSWMRAILAVYIAILLTLNASGASANPFTTSFTGIEYFISAPGTGTIKVFGNKLHMTDVVNIANDVVDDPRVSGMNTVVINAVLDLNDNLSGPLWGTAMIENDGGSWIGTWTGERTSDGFVYIRMSANGRGDYQGMHAWWNLERLSPDPAFPYTIRGTILDPGQ